MKIKRFFLPIMLGCLIGLSGVMYSCVSTPVKVEQKAEFKSIRKYNLNKTKHIDVLIPVGWPNFFEKPYVVVNVIPFSPHFVGMQIVNENDPEDIFVLGILFSQDGQTNTPMNYGHQKLGWYIIDQKTMIPKKATPKEVNAQVKQIVENDLASKGA